MENQTPQPLPWKLRPASLADAQPVADLIYAVCQADGDVTIAATSEDLQTFWQGATCNPAKDTVLFETETGQMAAYGECTNANEYAHWEADLYRHPDFAGKHIIPAILQWAETRARTEIPLAAPDLRVFIRSSMDGQDLESRQAHEAEGYTPVRYNWRMEITLSEQPPAPAFPTGIELRPFEQEAHARLLWQAENEAFREHWGSHDSTFEDWAYRKLRKDRFDPALWLVAWDGDQIAGFSQNRFRMGIGWVGTLGVRMPWRKSGLGLALLQHSFGEFYKRGTKTVGLGVDAGNTTGATRLYQRAGMHIASEFITFEKELRPGRELKE